MKIKTFVADSIPEAFRAIKAELGSEAVILGTKYVRTGWSWRHPIGRQQRAVHAHGTSPLYVRFGAFRHPV